MTVYVLSWWHYGECDDIEVYATLEGAKAGTGGDEKTWGPWVNDKPGEWHRGRAKPYSSGAVHIKEHEVRP